MTIIHEFWVAFISVLMIMGCFLVVISPLIFIAWHNNEFCSHDFFSIKKESTDIKIKDPYIIHIETEISRCIKCEKILISTTTYKIDTTGFKKTRILKDNIFLKQ